MLEHFLLACVGVMIGIALAINVPLHGFPV